jgi:hypothetical protein
MKLIPLTKTSGDAAAQIELRCIITGKTIKWNDAAAEGWKVDLEGKPFCSTSFYSPDRQSTLN